MSRSGRKTCGAGNPGAGGTGLGADGTARRLTRRGCGRAADGTGRAADGGRPAPSAARAAAQSWVGKLIEDSTDSFCEGQRVVTAFWRV